MADGVSSINGSSNTYGVSGTSSYDPTQRLQQLFEKLSGGSDSISSSQLTSFLQKMQSNQPPPPPDGDSDQDSTTSTDATSSTTSSTTTAASSALSNFQTSSDGSISESQFVAGMEKMHGSHRPPPPPSDGDSSSTSASSSADGKSKLFAELLSALQNSGSTSSTDSNSSSTDNSSTDNLFASLDSNGDGNVSKTELQSFLDNINQQMNQGTTYSTDGTSSSGTTDSLLNIQA